MDPPQRPIRITVSYKIGLVSTDGPETRFFQKTGFLICRKKSLSQKPGNSCQYLRQKAKPSYL
ncbi:MAG: hypothetical protein F6J93_10590 [Oscillatoria sp. SIO1A7]|nr:hypothetical protein [Oscillatoria sp. SIO1A7]